ncbi:hypothetical protein M422DRAFT_155523 [Sphaerobolus stellatus SS14]|nr:hypothetical protein M422DRAFT_155523 [Sphaerobolus stellatus SS14]
MTHTSLQQIFGLIPSIVSCYFTTTLETFDQFLKEIPEASIVWPSKEKMDEYEAMIIFRHRMLVEAFRSLDSLKLHIKVPSNPSQENAYYNGWVSGHFCSSVFGFAPDSTLTIVHLSRGYDHHTSYI